MAKTTKESTSLVDKFRVMSSIKEGSHQGPLQCRYPLLWLNNKFQQPIIALSNANECSAMQDLLSMQNDPVIYLVMLTCVVFLAEDLK